MQSKNSCGSKYYLNVSMTANNLKTLQKPICCHSAYRNVCSLVEPCDRACVCCMCIRDSPALDLGVFSELLTAVYDLCLKLFIGQSETKQKQQPLCTFCDSFTNFLTLLRILCSQFLLIVLFCLFIDELRWRFHKVWLIIVSLLTFNLKRWLNI